MICPNQAIGVSRGPSFRKLSLFIRASTTITLLIPSLHHERLSGERRDCLSVRNSSHAFQLLATRLTPIMHASRPSQPDYAEHDRASLLDVPADDKAETSSLIPLPEIPSTDTLDLNFTFSSIIGPPSPAWVSDFGRAVLFPRADLRCRALRQDGEGPEAGVERLEARGGERETEGGAACDVRAIGGRRASAGRAGHEEAGPAAEASGCSMTTFSPHSLFRGFLPQEELLHIGRASRMDGPSQGLIYTTASNIVLCIYDTLSLRTSSRREPPKSTLR